MGTNSRRATAIPAASVLTALIAAVAAALAIPSPAGASLPGASPLLTRAPYLTDLTASSVQVT